MSEQPLEIRDHRGAYYWIDRCVFEKFLPKIGVIGLAIYNAYCFYTNSRTQSSWPSVNTICKRLQISSPTFRKYQNKLIKQKLIKIKRRNGYTSIVILLKPNEEGGKLFTGGVVNGLGGRGKTVYGEQEEENKKEKNKVLLKQNEATKGLRCASGDDLIKNKHTNFTIRWGGKIQNILKLHGTYTHKGKKVPSPVKPTTWAKQIEYLLYTAHVDIKIFKDVMKWYLTKGIKLPTPKSPRIFRVQDLVDKWPAIVDSYYRNQPKDEEGTSGIVYRRGPDGEYGYYDDSLEE